MKDHHARLAWLLTHKDKTSKDCAATVLWLLNLLESGTLSTNEDGSISLHNGSVSCLTFTATEIAVESAQWRKKQNA